ncbi:MAG: hypothetical protein RLZZ129_656 [Verrucomicrobiota bacterium]|jgi:hypothetical protein
MSVNKGGRPAHQPTEAGRKQVESMAGYGIPADDIAMSLEISKPTLIKHYRRELDMGHIKANSAVAQSLYKKATGEGASAVTAAIFWLKTRAGWKETVVNEHSGPDGTPMGPSIIQIVAAGGVDGSD